MPGVSAIDFVAELAARGDAATRRRIAKRYAEFVDELAREELARIGVVAPPGSKEIGSYARATRKGKGAQK